MDSHKDVEGIVHHLEAMGVPSRLRHERTERAETPSQFGHGTADYDALRARHEARMARLARQTGVDPTEFRPISGINDQSAAVVEELVESGRSEYAALEENAEVPVNGNYTNGSSS